MDIQNFTTWENYYRLRTQQLENDNVELLVALEGLLNDIESPLDESSSNWWREKARTLVAKRRGQQ